MIYQLRHATTYEYSRPVSLGTHMLHLQPRSQSGQRVLGAAISVAPEPQRRTDGADHFGNLVTWLFLDQPHRKLQITATARVEVDMRALPPAAYTPAWERVRALAAAGGRDHAVDEFVHDSPMIGDVPEAGVYAAGSLTPGRPILEALVELTGRIRRDFRFRGGVTSIGTAVSTVLERREGVCQDFTHVMLAALRAHALPARYCSGYIRTRAAPGAARRLGSDVSHAWVEAWLGPEHGWVGLDPTNDLVVRDEHVLLAHGRDYGDISPVQGVILGGGRHIMTVSVDLQAEE